MPAYFKSRKFVQELRWVFFTFLVTVSWSTQQSWSLFIRDFVAFQVIVIIIPTCLGAMIRFPRALSHPDTLAKFVVLLAANDIYFIFLKGESEFYAAIAVAIALVNFGINNKVATDWTVWWDD